MRSNRFRKLYPVLFPTLRAIAIKLLNSHYSLLDVDDLVQEGLLAIKSTNTTKENPYTDKHLINRAKITMLRHLMHHKTIWGND